MQGAPGDGDLMLICIAPDKEGKFGFNVKVGLCLLFTTHTQSFMFITAALFLGLIFWCLLLLGWRWSEDASSHIAC